MLRNADEWFEFAQKKGTSGDMVFDILKDWKTEKENIKQETGQLWRNWINRKTGFAVQFHKLCDLVGYKR